MEVERSRAAYDAACLVYSHNEATKHLGKIMENDKKTVVFSMVTNGEQSSICGHFALAGDDGSITYHQDQLMTLPSMDDYETYMQARTITRNVQDLARQKSESLRDLLAMSPLSLSP